MKSEKQLTKRENLKIKAKESARKLKSETKKALNTAIVAAFGFIMALAWRDVIAEYINELASMSPAKGKLISALIITFVSVIGILIVAKLMRVEE
ncbi:MAG: hypothetical protein KKF67_00435 [Nanoarchaeota archaeon]|nr:hypothetical protein [Nanoarchaeota archaeon]